MFMLAAVALMTTAAAAEGEFSYDLGDTYRAPVLSFVIQQDDTEAVTAGMTIYVNDGETTRSRDLACILPAGIDSNRLLCQNGDHNDLIDVIIGELEVVTDEGTVLYDIVEVELLKLQRAINRMGAEIEAIEELEMGTYAAEAAWTGREGGWVCQLEDKDLATCSATCGGVGNIETLSTSASGATYSYFAEPSCDVSCECVGGTVHEWNDPAETLTALP